MAAFAPALAGAFDGFVLVLGGRSQNLWDDL